MRSAKSINFSSPLPFRFVGFFVPYINTLRQWTFIWTNLINNYVGLFNNKFKSILTGNSMKDSYVERERKSNIDINERRRLLRTKQSNEMNRLRQRQQQQIHQLIQKHRVGASNLRWSSLNPLWESESPLLYLSGKPFRMKGVEVELVKGIERSALSKPNRQSSGIQRIPLSLP